ncbi:glutathione-dependent formaldehyde-activating GFA [Ketogulonicigenium robustum]|uniref:Glutathione-dependent formaldehyde-activating GFA n=1 Tax=Ketogulonicigenium robustum TaxID=92947 RepID=A0A1W6NXQ9_9RHOB|nr:GFA family protein [Ketogulonicigenium robustum]ARO14035.1 glutathione-dependent formaldehyde-activating GFA [Ketogulonicigenium robustum]
MTDVCLDGSCHCGAVRFRVHLRDGLASARRCNCSYCTMRGAVAVSTRLDEFTILQGEDALSCYTFNTQQAKHYFCSACGIYTHHQRRSRPNEFGVNLACLAGHSPFDLSEVPVLNGRDHPRDGNPHRNPVFGTLIFRRCET